MINKTLRDEIAMAALKGMIATAKPIYSADNHKLTKPSQFAAVAYEYADAMLAARGDDKPKEGV